MHIPSKHVYEVLESKGVDSVHHANSLITACQFLRQKSLLSRGSVDRRGIKQTAQSSDVTDKRMSVWFDVFTDSVDIHRRAGRSNVYGPVMLELDAKIIANTYTGRVWLTKLNPTKWADKSDAQRWFQDKADLEENFTKGTFDQMIVFRHVGGELPFKSYLKRIVLDDPGMENDDGVDYFSMAVGALRLAMSDAGLDVPIDKRACAATCTCRAEYAANEERVKTMFDPKG
jgi:hypothetical protein